MREKKPLLIFSRYFSSLFPRFGDYAFLPPNRRRRQTFAKLCIQNLISRPKILCFPPFFVKVIFKFWRTFILPVVIFTLLQEKRNPYNDEKSLTESKVNEWDFDRKGCLATLLPQFLFQWSLNLTWMYRKTTFLKKIEKDVSSWKFWNCR